MLVTSHWPWFVQLLPSHERLSGHQLHSWRPRVGFIQSEGSFKQEKLSCLENFINFYHEIFYRFIAWLVTLSFPIWGFHSRPLIVSGWLYQSNEKKFVKGSPFYEHAMNSLCPVSMSSETTPGLLWNPLRIFVTQRPRDSDRDIIVTCHVRFAWRHLWQFCLLSVIIATGCLSKSVYD